MQCEILATGSAGNAVVLGGTILIDCGVSHKLLAPYVPDLQLVLLTHIHSDHFRRATIRRLAAERPRLRLSVRQQDGGGVAGAAGARCAQSGVQAAYRLGAVHLLHGHGQPARGVGPKL